MAPVNQMGTFAVTKTGLSPSCSRSGYRSGALKRDREKVTLSVEKSDTGFHMLGGGFFLFFLFSSVLLSPWVGG